MRLIDAEELKIAITEKIKTGLLSFIDGLDCAISVISRTYDRGDGR